MRGGIWPTKAEALQRSLQGADARSCRRCHELRADGIGDRLSQNAIDLGLRGGVERPAGDLVDGLQLPGVSRTLQCRRCTLIKDPARGQVDHPLAVTIPVFNASTSDGAKVLPVAPCCSPLSVAGL